jgi:raffinose/stachyose/melibiose transport system permease protein
VTANHAPEVPGPPARPRRRRGRAPGAPGNIGWLYLLPGLAFYVLFTLIPLAHAVKLSFYDWDGLTPAHYIGLGNYREALSDPGVRQAFQHVAELLVFYTVLPIAIGLLLTVLLTRNPVHGLTFFRTVLFLPQIVSGVVLAQAWLWIYDINGPVNRALELIGLGSITRAWLGDFTWSLPAIGTIGTWITTGFCMVVFLAGVQKIPDHLYDAARVDGAGAIREFFTVTLPGLRYELAFVLVLTTINALRSFDLIFNATAGGPGTQTMVPSVLMYFNAFVYNRPGYACAIAVLLTLAIVLVSTVVTRLVRTDD